MPNREVVLSAPLRTAIGTFGGALKETTATELGATAVRAVSRAPSSTMSPR
jgi:acetyl-CoA C-acetyltransferase